MFLGAKCTARARTGERCRAPAMKGYDVCRMHGGVAAKKNTMPGNLTGKEMRDRKAFLEALAGKDTETSHQLVAKAVKMAKAGSEGMLKWILEQQFGGPKSTIEVVIGDREIIDICARETARHLTGEAFEAWLQDFTLALRARSSSMASMNMLGQ